MRKLVSILIALSMSSVSFAQTAAIRQQSNAKATISAERIATLRFELAEYKRQIQRAKHDYNVAKGQAATIVLVSAGLMWLLSHPATRAEGEASQTRGGKMWDWIRAKARFGTTAAEEGTGAALEEGAQAGANALRGAADSLEGAGQSANEALRGGTTPPTPPQPAGTEGVSGTGAGQTATGPKTFEPIEPSTTEPIGDTSFTGQPPLNGDRLTSKTTPPGSEQPAAGEKTKGMFARAVDKVKGVASDTTDAAKDATAKARVKADSWIRTMPSKGNLARAATGIGAAVGAYYFGVEQLGRLKAEIERAELNLEAAENDLIFLEQSIRLSESL